MRMERARWRDTTHTQTASTLSHACTRCLYVTQGKCAKKMCVRHGVCVYSPSHTLQLLLFVSKTQSRKKKLRLRHSMSILIFPTKTCSTSSLSTNYQMFESMRLGFPRLALYLILDDASVWNLNLSGGSPRSTMSNCVRGILAIRTSPSLDHRDILFLLDIICGF